MKGDTMLSLHLRNEASAAAIQSLAQDGMTTQQQLSGLLELAKRQKPGHHNGMSYDEHSRCMAYLYKGNQEEQTRAALRVRMPNTHHKVPTDTINTTKRLAVEAGVFPLYEVEKGKYKMTVEVPKLRPIGDYLKGQGRFRHLTEDMIDDIQKQVIKDYQTIRKLTRSSRRTR